MPPAADASASDPGCPASGWWKTYVEAVPDGYLDLIAAEEDASRIVHFHPVFVPGLLQTERYAAAITLATTLKTMTAKDAATLVRIRLLRQRAAFDGERPKRLLFILDESSLRRPVGSADTMREQLGHLRDVAAHPGVTLVVVPFDALPHPGLLGAFTLFGYSAGIDDVLCFEWQLGNTVIRDQPDLVRRYRELAERLAAADLDGTRAMGLIAAAMAAVG